MSLVMVLYLIDIMSKVSVSLTIFIFIGVFVFLGTSIVSVDERDNQEKNFSNLKFLRKILVTLVCLIMAKFFIPSERTIYLMASSHYIEKTDIPEKVLKIFNEKLDEIMETKNEK